MSVTGRDYDVTVDEGIPVRLYSGATFYVLTQDEADYLDERIALYGDQNHFTNISDIQDIDKMVIFELFIHRWSLWLSKGVDYWNDQISQRELSERVNNTSRELRQIKTILGIDKKTRDRTHGDDCHDDQTEVLTEHGWMLFKNVPDGTALATRSPEGNIEYQQPIARQSYQYEGDLFVHEAPKLNFAVTPNHRLLIEANDCLYLRPIKELGGTTTPYVLPKIATTGERCDNYIAFEDPPRGRSSSQILPKIPVVKFARWLGLFVSEGTKVSGLKGCVARIHQTKPDGIDAIDAVMEDLGWPYERKVGVTGEVVWKIRSQGLCAYLSMLEIGVELRLPPEVFTEWTLAEQEALLDGLVIGDGTCRLDGRMLRYYTSSRCLADDVQRLVLHVGRWGSIRRLYQAGRVVHRGGVTYRASKDGWAVSIASTGSATLFMPNVKRVSYNGVIYCFTVPNCTLLTRRGPNSVPVWSGNSVPAYLDALKMRAKEFGIVRNKQFDHVITAFQRISAFLGYHDRCDDQERKEFSVTVEDLIQVIRDEVAAFEAIDEEFRKTQQKLWIRRQ